MKGLGSWVIAAAVVGLAGCMGTVEDGGPWRPGGSAGSPGPREGASSFSCDESAVPDALPLRRLSTPEYRRTLRDLLSVAVDGSTSGAVLAESDDSLRRLPDEPLDTEVAAGEDRIAARYGRLVQDVSQIRVDTYHDVALAVGASLTSTPARLEALMGACATDGDPANDAACLDGFVDRFATAAFRAPLDPDERAFLRDEAYIDGDVVDPVGVGELVAVILMSPRFLYHFELGSTEPRGGVVQMTGYELASRLSYHFWGTMPDAELLAAAESGALETDEGYAEQVERMIDDPRTRESLDTFFAQWLGIAEMSRLDEGAGDPRFDAFFGAYTPSDRLHEDMVREVLDFASYTVLDERGTLGDLFTSTASFPRTDELAELYGVARWDDGDAPVELPASERAGLLTRAALLAIPSVYPHPILRGVFVRRHVICDELPEPPGDLVLPELDPAMSSREFAEEVTSPAACQSCHQNINALGFALGHYDALGRYVTAEQLLDESGGLIDEPAVDARSQPHVSLDDDTTTADAIELSGLVASSAKVEACFTRHYFRFTHRRVEDVERDGCALENMRQVLAEGGSVADLLRAAALDPEFRVRRLMEGE